MKRVWITLGLTLMLMAGGGQGYYGFGTSPVCGQPPPYPPPPYNNPYYYPPPANYYNYYSAPYADPLPQFFYYVVPQLEWGVPPGQVYREHPKPGRGLHRGWRHDRD